MKRCGCATACSKRGFVPEADLLSFERPKESRQRKGRPSGAKPPALLASRGARQRGHPWPRWRGRASMRAPFGPVPREAPMLGAPQGDSTSKATSTTTPRLKGLDFYLRLHRIVGWVWGWDRRHPAGIAQTGAWEELRYAPQPAGSRRSRESGKWFGYLIRGRTL